MSQPTDSAASPPKPGRQSWLAALAVIPVLATVYQTLVLTDVTDDVVRKGIEGEHYSMIWTTVCWGVATLYGVFGGLWAMARFGKRDTLKVGLVLFTLGNLLCGSAFDVPSLAIAKVVEGLGKGATIVVCRALLYSHFDRAVIVAITFYGVLAYSTRPSTPLITSLINDNLSWRWIFWINVPFALLGLILVHRLIKPDRPPKPLPLQIDWFAVLMLVFWVISLLFAFSWYRKWGGLTSNAFTITVILAILLPIGLAVWVGGGFTPDEHLRRIVRVRGYIYAMSLRMLLLLHLAAVVGILGKYFTSVRDFPREDAGWLLAAATLPMAASTFLTSYFHRRSLRHVWLLVGVLGSSASIWWMASMDLFTSHQNLAQMVACWGLFLGLLPPVFLMDEVEALDRRDALYAGALAVVFLVVPLVTIPTMASTIVSDWSDRALDVERLNLRAERPIVDEASKRIADYYQQRSVTGAELSQQTGTVLGTYATLESVVQGIQAGFTFLSIVTAAIGVILTFSLISATRAPPSAAKSS